MTQQCVLADRDPVSGYCPVQLDPSRTMLGEAQRDWLLDGLAAAPTSGWNVLGNQVGFAAQDGNTNPTRRSFFTDPWDGYVADRQRILDFIKANDITNLVVITGDKHQNSVRNVAEHYTHWWQEPWITTEFIGTSISSEGDQRGPEQTGGTVNNPHILRDEFSRGYVRVELDRNSWRTDFRVVASVTTPEFQPAWTLESWIVEHGKPGAHPVT
jgi:alkaline phosphatase D